MGSQVTTLAEWGNLVHALGPDCLRIASYNVHRCVGGDGRQDATRVAHVIHELGCDTVGLQEVDNQPDGSHDSMQLDYIASVTGMTPIAGHTIVRHQGHFGNALLTRRPILDVRRHELNFGRREPRGALEVDIDVAGRMVRIFVTHLGLRPAERRYQVQKMMALLQEIPEDQPVVVLGDINEWLPLGRPLRWLHELMGHAPAERSFPARMPMFALDRVWVRPRQNLLAFGTHRSTTASVASDHLPVMAIVALGEHPTSPGFPYGVIRSGKDRRKADRRRPDMPQARLEETPAAGTNFSLPRS